MKFLRKPFIVLIILAITTSLLCITADAGNLAYGAATVAATSLNIRTNPDTESSILLSVEQDDIVVILEMTSSDWYHVNFHGVEGYVAAQYLKNVLTAENFTATGKVTGDDVLIRTAPKTSSSQRGSCDLGTIVKIIGINTGWYKVKFGGDTGYIRSDFVTVVSDGTSSKSGSSSATHAVADNVNAAQLTTEQLALRQQIVDFALQYVGYDYVYGGESPSSGFDCSGLVSYVFHHFNYAVTRTASSQYAQDGSIINKADMIPGDLVFFSSNGGYSITHVGIYIGNNQFVHASSPKIGVVISSLDSAYYTHVWYGAKRVL